MNLKLLFQLNSTLTDDLCSYEIFKNCKGRYGNGFVNKL
jgi:hypothetical protein